MLSYCNHCRVTVRGSDDICPLCRNPMPPVEKNGMDLAAILAEEELCQDVFPYVDVENRSHRVIRLLSVISIAAVVISFLTRMTFPTRVNWPIFVLISVIFMWLSVATILRKHHNVSKTIIWQVVLWSGTALLFDRVIGWRGWSLNYFIPILCATGIVTVAVLANVLHLHKGDYIVYLILGALLGLIPFLFIILDWVRVLLPAVMCVALSISFLAAVLIFYGRLIFNETRKRFHL